MTVSRTWLAKLFALAALISTAADGANSDERLALVIGNGNYKAQSLRNPVNDARDLAEALNKLGFSVTRIENATLREMTRAITELGRRLPQGNTTVVFYYAGHGIQVRGRNYLIPIDADISSEASVLSESVDLEHVIAQIGERAGQTSVIVLDACRNNPFEGRFRSTAGGLAQVTAGGNMLISYATAPGQVAADGNGRNGTFTAELLSVLPTPNLKIEDVFKRVRAGVSRKTLGKQIPWESSSLVEDFYFVRSPQKSTDPEIDIWENASRSGLLADLDYYVTTYPEGRFVGLARHRMATMQSRVAALPSPPSLSAPPPPPAAKRELFSPGAVSSVSGANRATLEAFAKATPPKALAWSQERRQFAFNERGESLDEVRRRALEQCVFVSKGPCRIYAENEFLATEGDRSLAPEALPKANDQFDPDRVPFVRNEARLRLDGYQRAPGSKVLALAPDGAWRWISGRDSKEAAAEEALKGCQQLTKARCVVYAVDDVVRW